MFPLFALLAKIREKLKGAMFSSIVSTTIIVIYGTFSEYFIERGAEGTGVHSLFDSFWWVMQTVTTVGYGDTPIVSFWGRINAVVVMLLGIGSLGVLLASIGANLVDLSIRKRLGEVRIRMKDHVIICNLAEGLDDLVLNLNREEMDIAILADTDPKISKGKYAYVHGSCTSEEDLKKAGIDSASKVIILPGGSGDPNSIDAKVILTSMIVKKARNDSYVIVEILRGENAEHAKMAGADEVVIKGSMSTLMLASAVSSPGVSRVFYELLRGEDGYRLREYPVETNMKGKKCREFYETFEKEGRVVLGFRSGDTVKLRPDPESNMQWDFSIVMEERGRED
ncbi:MAG: potassium channel family protein [Thermoplasmatales archaeon]